MQGVRWLVYTLKKIGSMFTLGQDRRQITMADLVEPAPPGQVPEVLPRDEEENPKLHTASSAKIEQLVKLLQLTPSNEKSLVFSQFTTFLDKVTFDIFFSDEWAMSEDA